MRHEPPGSSDIEVLNNALLGNPGSGVCLVNRSQAYLHHNSIFGNSHLGIDLGDDSVTPNGSVGHTGPNNYTEFPVLTRAYVQNGNTVIEGTMFAERLVGQSYTIEVFASSRADRTGYGQGETQLTAVRTVLIGSAYPPQPFRAVYRGVLPRGTIISATATDEDGNTSEFSRNITVTTP